MAAGIIDAGYRLRRRRARRSCPTTTIAKLTEFFDNLVQRRLSQTLDRLNNSNLEMQLFVWRPFDSAFRGRKLVDQIQQTIRSNQFGMCGERPLHVRIDILLKRVRFNFEYEEIAQISDQI